MTGYLLQVLGLEFMEANQQPLARALTRLASEVDEPRDEVFHNRASDVVLDLSELTIAQAVEQDRDFIRVGDFLVAFAMDQTWKTYPTD